MLLARYHLHSSDLSDEGETKHLQYLNEMLEWIQLPPTGTGSGFSSLRHKIQAVLHSTKLTTKTWPNAVALTNTSFSCTADLGTESSYNQYCGSATGLMGI